MFSERILKRRKIWWRHPDAQQTLIDHLRRGEMLHLKVGRNATESRWHRGEYWQRRLLNKLNSKEFAIRLNCPVPELYWHGRFLRRSVVSSLPDAFVLKPALGTARHGVNVVAGSTELLSGRSMTRSELLDEVASDRGKFSVAPLLAEEFVTNEMGEYTLPVEYKFHVFSDEIGAIEVVHRSANQEVSTAHRFYSADWEAFDDPMQTSWPLAEVITPPACFDQMKETALKLGKHFGTFVRVDLYAGAGGCVFGEFSSVPYAGKNFTTYANELFEAMWQEKFPDSI
jgi:hypothetical protein